MDCKYFGILRKKLTDLDRVKELESFLLEKKLIVWVKRGKIIKSSKTDNIGELKNLIEFDPKNAGYEFTNEFTIKVHEFLLNHYKNGLGRIDLFNNDFDNETFGFLEANRREIALKHFNILYPIWTTNLPVLLEYKENNKLGSENQFNKLKRVKNFYQNQIKYQTELATAYLIGDINYFNRALFESDKLILEMFDFENDLLILISLNKRFLFTENKAFTTKSIAQNIYEKYPIEFDSILVIEFIESIMTSPKYRYRKYGLALFYALKEELNLINASTIKFNEVLTLFFNCDFKNLQLGNKYAKSHDDKVKMFKLSYQEFIK
jgi:hypothetical protein